MNPNYLDFEQPIADLEAKIQELRNASAGPAVNVEAEVQAVQTHNAAQAIKSVWGVDASETGMNL